MNCTACNSILAYKGGQNKEDFGCQNMSCPSRKEALYYTNVKVRNGWWFSPQYNLPFKYKDEWYCLEGPTYIHDIINPIINTDECSDSIFLTSLKLIIMVEDKVLVRPSSSWNWIWGSESRSFQKEIWHIPYYALPVNQDFNEQYNILRSKIDKYFKTYRYFK